MKSERARKAKQIKRSLKRNGLHGADLQRAFEAQMKPIREMRQRNHDAQQQHHRRMQRIRDQEHLRQTGRDHQAEAVSLRRLELFDMGKISRLMATEDMRLCPKCGAQFVTVRGDSETSCWGCR